MKRLLRDSWTTDLPGQLSAETTQMSEAGASDDAAEGIAAFLAKTRAHVSWELKLRSSGDPTSSRYFMN